jgi:hypothetical protein
VRESAFSAFRTRGESAGGKSRVTSDEVLRFWLGGSSGVGVDGCIQLEFT